MKEEKKVLTGKESNIALNLFHIHAAINIDIVPA